MDLHDQPKVLAGVGGVILRCTHGWLTMTTTTTSGIVDEKTFSIDYWHLQFLHWRLFYSTLIYPEIPLPSSLSFVFDWAIFATTLPMFEASFSFYLLRNGLLTIICLCVNFSLYWIQKLARNATIWEFIVGAVPHPIQRASYKSGTANALSSRKSREWRCARLIAWGDAVTLGVDIHLEFPSALLWTDNSDEYFLMISAYFWRSDKVWLRMSTWNKAFGCQALCYSEYNKNEVHNEKYSAYR